MSTVPTSAPDEEQAFAEQSQPLNIHFHFALSSNTPEDDEDYLRNRLLPSTAAVLKQFIQVWLISSLELISSPEQASTPTHEWPQASDGSTHC